MDMIYHYTTLNSFKGMLHSPTLNEMEKAEVNNDLDICQYLEFHASDARMMNDKKENKLVNDVIQNAPKELWLSLCFETGATSTLYAISFCKQKDYVPMWKEYAIGNDGICLCFCADKLESKTIKLHENSMCGRNSFCLGECKYLSPSAMEAECEYIIKKLKVTLNAHKGNILPVQEKIRQMVLQSAFCKSEEFEYEHEVRLAIVTPQWGSNIKEGRYGITVYKQVNIPLSLLKEIIISPFTTRADIIECEIIKLLKDTLFPDTISSEIPVKVGLSKFAQTK